MARKLAGRGTGEVAVTDGDEADLVLLANMFRAMRNKDEKRFPLEIAKAVHRMLGRDACSMKWRQMPTSRL
jgi:hypothetical protein